MSRHLHRGPVATTGVQLSKAGTTKQREDTFYAPRAAIDVRAHLEGVSCVLLGTAASEDESLQAAISVKNSRLHRSHTSLSRQ